ncbi:MAG: hypothetical protein JNM49_01125 [Flavobacteriales bacterium]|nr:hypothetical protein [Flavobacteriales bacterium]
MKQQARPPLRSLTFVPCILWAGLSAQTVTFHFTNGAEQSHYLADIRKLTYAGDSQVLWLYDGSQFIWDLSTIGSIAYSMTTDVQHIAAGIEPLRLHMYPNPAPDGMVIEMHLPHAMRLTVEMLDMDGREVRSLYSGDRPAGPFRLHWNAIDDRGARVAPGAYLVRMSSHAVSSAGTVVIQ